MAMNTKQQQAAIKAQTDAQLKVIKEQKASRDYEFNQSARRDAIQTAHYVEKGQPTERVIQSAEKIYQWLIKVLK